MLGRFAPHDEPAFLLCQRYRQNIDRCFDRLGRLTKNVERQQSAGMGVLTVVAGSSGCLLIRFAPQMVAAVLPASWIIVNR